MAFSLLLSYYVSNFGPYNKAYGSLAGVFILMLYNYYCCRGPMMGQLRW